ncbi:unnamed protein product, partial [marine sediment metagenome]
MFPDHTAIGGAPECSDMPDHSFAILVPNKNTWQDAENIDQTHPYISYIWIPEETQSVQIMKAHIWAEKFRAYSKGAAAGGATVVASASGGKSHAHTVDYGTKTSVGGGEHRHMMFDYLNDIVDGVDRHYICKDVAGALSHVYIRADEAEDLYSIETVVDHTHNVVIGADTSTYVTPSHTHNVTIPNHTHNITYGIYEEAIAGKKLSAALYDKDGNLLHNFAVIITG